MTAKGTLTTYLGTAPGVGKTAAMLAEGQRRATNGERVVIGWLEEHGRPETDRRVGDLEVVPPRRIPYRGATFADLDAPAAIATRADVVLVDELARSAVDSSRRRWEDVADILEAGADVLTTTNVANLQSAREYAAQVTGVGTVAFVPDEFVRSGQVVLVDLPAAALRQRIASGLIYSADQVGGALADYFRAANLEALSELGRAWIADTLDTIGNDILARRGLLESVTSPVVVAGDSGSRWGKIVIRRAARVARDQDAQLVVVHVQPADGLAHPRRRDLERHRELTVELGGTYVDVAGSRPADALAAAARARKASTVVVALHHSRLREITRGSISTRLRRLLPDTAIEVVHATKTGTVAERE